MFPKKNRMVFMEQYVLFLTILLLSKKPTYSANRMTTSAIPILIVGGRCSGISYTYRDYIEQPQDLTPVYGPPIGDRAPDADLADGNSLFGLTRHTRFTLLAMPGTDGDSANTDRSLQDLQERFDPALACHRLDTSAELERYYGRGPEDRLYLVRPHGYIGDRCLASEVDHVNAYLGEFLTV